jgi:eukaryotic-like serine/threonine-protein kinase
MKCEACGKENVDGARFCATCGVHLATKPQESDDPMVGQVIGGRYRITGVLGEGGMGIVYAGEQPMGTTIRKVAIKTLHPHLSKDPSVLARFHRECGTVAQLEHPNTIKFFDFGATDDGTLYIVMEFVSGRPLNDVIAKEGRLGAARVIHIMRQVCGALDEAHQQGIIHRDLKPDNLILTNRAGETDVVKVLDFGIAGRTESTDAQKEQKLTQQGMVLGTPPYMSPEQFTGKALDARSDIYSLAVVAYEMLSGKLPFDAETPWQWATQHMTAQPTPLELAAADASIPENLRVAIMRGLSKDREKRQATAREFFAELSGGSRMTIEQAAETARAATAAMQMPPNFGPAGVAATAAMPQQSAAQPQGFGAPAPMPQQPPAAYAPVVPAVPAAPPGPSARRGGNKWLVPTLGGVGALLAVAILIVLIRSGKSTEPTQVSTLSTSTSSGGPTTISPQLGADPGSATAVAAEVPSSTERASEQQVADPGAAHPPPTSNKAKSKAAGENKTGAADAGKTEPPKDEGKTKDSKDEGKTKDSKDEKKKKSGDTCAACTQAASAGNIAGALKAYQSCSDEASKKACSRAAGNTAPEAAKRAAFNGNCAAAEGILAAAKQMGAGGRGKNALKGTPCEK